MVNRMVNSANMSSPAPFVVGDVNMNQKVAERAGNADKTSDLGQGRRRTGHLWHSPVHPLQCW